MAQERKAALRMIPEQAILVEVRCMVEEMQALNRKLEETEIAIEEYFKPIDKEAEIIMNMQIEREERMMRAAVKAMQEQALMEKVAAEKIVKEGGANSNCLDQDKASTPANEALAKYLRKTIL
eukprot:TRINITY_DN3941_c0_g1_i1.p2 TRINITY_DN3941_c0_g1~~TRINITY_DN3941_c0_g1_i1.p2  ORF type:complete len:123 (+),score=42.71 TRINITY_DN3941_c0_g1_i1:248-616(+)